MMLDLTTHEPGDAVRCACGNVVRSKRCEHDDVVESVASCGCGMTFVMVTRISDKNEGRSRPAEHVAPDGAGRSR